MSTTLHIGKKRVQTISTSDASALPANAVTVTGVTGATSCCTVAVDGTTNAVTVTGVEVGGCTLVYSAPGYVSTSENIGVVPQPSLIVTDGPEQ